MMDFYGPEALLKIRRTLERRLRAAAIHVSNAVKVILSVPAPRRIIRYIDPLSGKKVKKYIATEPATPGAPPRKLSGRLRASIGWEVDAPSLTARVGTNVKYAKRLELGQDWGAGTQKRGYVIRKGRKISVGRGTKNPNNRHPFFSVVLRQEALAIEQILGGSFESQIGG